MVASSPSAEGQDENFEFTDQHFETIREVVTSTIGVQLPDIKRQLAYSRFAKRMRKIGVSNFDQYIARLKDPTSGEMDALPSIITTNMTSFFRERHHFDYLAQTVLPALRDQKRIRIWCCASSTGEEPYSIASVVMDVLGGPSRTIRNDVKILATDIDTQVLDHAKAGIYQEAKVPADFRSRWTQKRPDGSYEIVPELRQLLTFKRLNLLGDWPMKGPFDVIFNRNVVIYFDLETKSRIFQRQSDLQRPGDTLMIGHSEQLTGPADRYERLGHTIYKRL